MNKNIEQKFEKIASICVAWPWEVIFTISTLTLVIITCYNNENNIVSTNIFEDDNWIDGTLNYLIFVIFLYTIKECHSLLQKGSQSLKGIVILLIVSTFICCSSVLKLLNYGYGDLKGAAFFSMLFFIWNLKSTIEIAEFALKSSSYDDVNARIVKGLSQRGLTIVLDTTLLAFSLSFGVLSKLVWLVELMKCAVIAAAANFITLMFFYPSYLSLKFELSRRSSSGCLHWMQFQIPNQVDEFKSNTLHEILKFLMSTGMVSVQIISIYLSPQNLEGRIKFSKGIENTHSSPPSSWLNEVALLGLIFVIPLVLFTIKNLGKNSPTMIDARTQTQYEAMQDTKTSTSFCQTDATEHKEINKTEKSRSLEECLQIFEEKDGIFHLEDDEILLLAQKGKLELQLRKLEEILQDTTRAVKIRRNLIAPKLPSPSILDKVPYENYDFAKVYRQCCENVIGYIPVPLGLAGPLKVNGQDYNIPLSTTEGALVASTNRACKALSLAGGVSSVVYNDGMTRAPVVEFPTIEKSLEAYKWLGKDSSFLLLKESFDSTSNYAKLKEIYRIYSCTKIYLRFVATTGDAMGMNMVSKGSQAALDTLKKHFPEMKICLISSNVCTDKKPSAINWIMGRGKSVACEATLPANIVKSVLKTNAKDMVENNIKKNYEGSALAGSIGGYNAHAANIVTAMFIACGQDVAQVVESSTCMTNMKFSGATNEDLYVSVTMPSLEVGTVGGGTILGPQASCLELLGVKGSSNESPGKNAQQFAKIVASAVLAAEISLMAALTEQTLVSSHLILNRRTTKTS